MKTCDPNGLAACQSEDLCPPVSVKCIFIFWLCLDAVSARQFLELQPSESAWGFTDCPHPIQVCYEPPTEVDGLF